MFARDCGNKFYASYEVESDLEYESKKRDMEEDIKESHA